MIKESNKNKMARSVVVGAVLLLGIFSDFSYGMQNLLGGETPVYGEIPSEVVGKITEHTNALMSNNPGITLTPMKCTQQVGYKTENFIVFIA